jgi:hypothetical protein
MLRFHLISISLIDYLHCVCLEWFTKEENKKERDNKKIGYFCGLDKERNKEKEKYNG